jgi:putative restriction endonuclease
VIEENYDEQLRRAAMAWLDELRRQGRELLRFDDLAKFIFDGRRIPLMDRQRGIRKPASIDSALSFRTTFTPPGQIPPYEDTEGPDGLLRYKYRGEDPTHPENVALRRSMQLRRPVIWFVGVASGWYLPRYPVWLVADEPQELQFAIAMDEVQLIIPRTDSDPDSREYVKRLTKLRLHQPVFRARVLRAYESKFAICRLRHATLLDAAHILPDTHPRGTPIVPNGLSLCKIHHAAYDQNIIGIRPDLVVEVRADILHEIDGPMLRHGIQEMAGITVASPRGKDSRPDRLRLEERYEAFRAAS